jgi:hypothetical protein
MSLRNAYSRLARVLVAYYALIEVGHLLALIWAGIRLLLTGTIGFPAPRPVGGWEPQVVPFLVATGVVDALNVPLAWRFAYGYFRRAPWRWWLGGITLSLSVYSAIVFTWGTMAAGAWRDQPAAYLAMVVFASPVVVLAVLYGVWGATGLLDKD